VGMLTPKYKDLIKYVVPRKWQGQRSYKTKCRSSRPRSLITVLPRPLHFLPLIHHPPSSPFPSPQGGNSRRLHGRTSLHHRPQRWLRLSLLDLRLLLCQTRGRSWPRVARGKLGKFRERLRWLVAWLLVRVANGAEARGRAATEEDGNRRGQEPEEWMEEEGYSKQQR
jgi:hypothetical protein